MAGDGRRLRRRGIAGAAGVAVLVLGSLLGFALLGHGGGGAAGDSGEIWLTPASSTGPNPFTASLMTQAASAVPPSPPAAQETPPTAPEAEAPPRSAPATPAGPAANAPAATLTTVDASVPQLYGGVVGAGRCDPALLAGRLDADHDLATAWAQAEGIDPGDAGGFAAGLVPVDLLDDVMVTDWRRVDGRGVAVQVVLQRATTVLVDGYGLPRVRCRSGDPLGLPGRVHGGARFAGRRWARFSPQTVIAIVPAKAVVPTLVLLDTTSGQPFGRPVGGGRPDIDTPTLIADQAQLGVSVSPAAEGSADATQSLQLSPWGGPPGSTVLAFGTGWPAGDRVRIEPCVGGRPETCALRAAAAVVTVAGPDGSFHAATLQVPGDVGESDYVEFYAQDLDGGHAQTTFDAPWTVAPSECRDDCGGVVGCHPPYCGGGADEHEHGCRCRVRLDAVCEVDGCGGCPKDRCALALREEPPASARARPSGSAGESVPAHAQGSTTTRQSTETRSGSLTTTGSASSTTESRTTSDTTRPTRTTTQSSETTRTRTTEQGSRTTQESRSTSSQTTAPPVTTQSSRTTQQTRSTSSQTTASQTTSQTTRRSTTERQPGGYGPTSHAEPSPHGEPSSHGEPPPHHEPQRHGIA